MNSRQNANLPVDLAERGHASQPLYPPPSPSIRSRVIREIFGSSNANNPHLNSGLSMFCDHLQEHCFPQFGSFDTEVWTALNRPPPSTPAGQWEWCIAVVRASSRLPVSHDLQVKALVAELLHDATIRPGGLSVQQEIAIADAATVTLFWLSAAFIFPFNANGRLSLLDSLFPSTADSQMLLEKSLFEVYEILHWRSSRYNLMSVSAAGKDDMLYEPRLGYDSLGRYGGIRLKWVETLSDHLSLDTRNRTLSIFKFPSLCAARVLRHNDFVMDNAITNRAMERFSIRSADDVDGHMCQEVLLSYRLLFGQNSAARKLLKKALEGETSVDPFLMQFTKSIPKWTVSRFWPTKGKMPFDSSLLPERFRKNDGSIMEWGTYSASIDFPIYGEKLQNIQTYGSNHPATSFMEYLWDRRYPVQQYSAWLAVNVGLVTTVVGVGQLVMSSVDVATTR
ncbi:uncharacterized protein DSM5745_06952 [Aspergillus mulundensis]|uniref:Uncharacterized protein n=1 Tax=Aspergillus mulundensis TaxID=1810919 RepID=A0A3D8RJZ1_9EURO|nr:hypothetical protein DSM5745_06952 [Aspergillus mulundensis]RDW74290.1 hypothetical protein DSM5745_06952 [Aspergillus mulundensis]